MAMNLNDLNNVNWSDPGAWPGLIKGIAILLLCIAIGAGGYFFDYQSQQQVYEAAQSKEADLLRTFSIKQSRAVNLDAYRQQLAEMDEKFGTMLRQLPSKTEVPELLVDITQTGLAAGLEFTLFKPVGEVRRDFYAELPINLEVSGTYHQIGEFVGGVAALPRIVTLHDIQISSNKDGDLLMKATARTYRYLDQEEMGG